MSELLWRNCCATRIRPRALTLDVLFVVAALIALANLTSTLQTSTYQAAYAVMPRRWREVLEGEGS